MGDLKTILEEAKKDLEATFNPSPNDLLLDEHRGEEKPVIYLRDALETVEILLAKIEGMIREEGNVIDAEDSTVEQIHTQIDVLVGELEKRTSKFKKNRSLVSEIRECYKKVQYQKLRTAHNRAKKYEEEFGIKQRVYQCNTCGLWHITTKPKANLRSKPNA